MSYMRIYLILLGAFAVGVLAGCTTTARQLAGGFSGTAESYPDFLADRIEPLGAGTYEIRNHYGSVVVEAQPVTVTTAHVYKFTLQGLSADATFYTANDTTLIMRVRVGSAYQHYLAQLKSPNEVSVFYTDEVYPRWRTANYPGVVFTRADLSPPFRLPDTAASVNRRMLLDLAAPAYRSDLKLAFTILLAPAQAAAAQ